MTKTASVSVSKISLTLLRISIGVIYLWFGALKIFYGYSPAEDLAINTIVLATWECVLGFLLIAGIFLRAALLGLFVHMLCTFTPLLFFPSVSFKYAPYGFTLVGQYIMKNIIIICAALVIWPGKKMIEKEEDHHSLKIGK